MKRALIYAAVIGALLPSLAGVALAADQDRDQNRLRDKDRLTTPDKDQTRDRDRLQKQEPIYGSQLMTQQERNEYRARMQAARTIALYTGKFSTQFA